jgi:hypothetical protein
MISEVLRQGVHVSAGKDRLNEHGLMIWGLIPLSTKVSTQDTSGGFYAFEHTNMAKGGRPATFTMSRTSGSMPSKGSLPSRSVIRSSG